MAAPMKFQTRVVGWRNKDEFIDIYNCIYHKSELKRRDGLGRINAWKSRFGDKMPVAIESTATLQEATLMDETDTEPHQLQLIYSMAIVRFVNLMTGYLQTKIQAQPVVALAKEISLPEWIVELRHEASHKHMPSLAVLRLAAKTGLTWLDEIFWEKQCRTEPQEMLQTEQEITYPQNISGVEDNIKRLVINYQQAQFKNIQRGCRGESVAVTEILANLEPCLTDPEARYLIMSLLLQDGYLVPTSEQLQALHIKEGFSLKDGIVFIHKLFCQFWRPLILLLDSLELTPLLLQYIIRELGRFTAIESHVADYLQGWALQILLAGSRDRSMYKNVVIIFRQFPKLPWADLFDECIQHPNRFTLNLLQYILPNLKPTPSEEVQLQIKQLSSIFCNIQQTENNSNHDGSKIYTAEDIGTEIQKVSGKTTVLEWNSDVGNGTEVPDKTQEFLVLKEADDIQPWSKSTVDVDWSKFPIGSLPWQLDDPNCLMLDIPQSKGTKRLQQLKTRESTQDQASEISSQANKRFKTADTELNVHVVGETDYLTKKQMDNIKQRIQVF